MASLSDLDRMAASAHEHKSLRIRIEETMSETGSVDAPEVIYVKDQRISCDGGGGALGHPVVYYTLKDGVAECGYCGRRFVFDPEKAR